MEAAVDRPVSVTKSYKQVSSIWAVYPITNIHFGNNLQMES